MWNESEEDKCPRCGSSDLSDHGDYETCRMCGLRIDYSGTSGW